MFRQLSRIRFLLLAFTFVNGARAEDEIVVNVQERRNLVAPKEGASKSTIERTRIETMPGGASAALPKVISTLTPGAVPGPFGQLFIRGNHANLQYQIDGVQLPESASGTFGEAFSPRNVEKLEVITGGVPAEYGERLAAVVNITTKQGPETPQGEVELKYGSYDTLFPQANYGGTDASGRLRYFLAGSYMQTERGLDTPNPASETDQSRGGSEAVHDRATSNDAFARVDYQLDDVNRFVINVFWSQRFYQIPNYPDSFKPGDAYFQPGYADSFGNRADDATQPTYRYAPAVTDDSQTEQNASAQIVWKRALSERASMQVAPYYKRSQIGVGADPANDLASKTLIANDAQVAAFTLDRAVDNYGLKSDFVWRATDEHQLKAGFQAQQSNAAGSFTLQTDPNAAAARYGADDSGFLGAAYAQDAWRFARDWSATYGLRYSGEQFNSDGLSSQDQLFQPRVGVEWTVAEGSRLHAFYGKLFQPAPFENLRQAFVASGGGNSAAPYDVKAEKDDYYEIGLAQQIGGSHVANFVVYYKDATDMLDDAQLLNTSIAQPYNYAKGYAQGAEVSLSGDLTPNLRHFENYSYQEAKGRGLSGGIFAFDPNAAAQPDAWRYLDHSQRHTANVGLTYARDQWFTTAQAQYGSGLRTGSGNDKDLPGHFTLDLSAGWSFRGDDWLSKWRLAADVTNLFDNPYPITINNGFNGSHYAVGRQYFVRLAKTL